MTTQHTDEIREAFEKWADGYFAHGVVWKRLDKSEHGNYQNAAVQTAWNSWRAANIIAKIPTGKSYDEGYLEATRETLQSAEAKYREALEENARWRASHASGAFNPDWCAASEVLKEHLAFCQSNAEAKYLPVIEKATALCDEMARDGYQNAKLEAVRELRQALATLLKGE